ncbi:hypothetical protein PHLGIDRAFT_116276 [Phlebiopsis gigantea 11061_1 CR5-6]|uniref:Peptide-N4-(N-acetyl-beta-glucosaminyl)asparagine amidase A n=1 Tax=Phlebiopsis gigantea (strain 11061_1 CR5-6) TaxID=745531 RepID=A0A0C3SAS3_PHLG1|nr:hypothetical protein PHLGIDRAFT_116276 [Phlebiopsis gigantea 11061_1 CR5-6]
MLTLSLVPALLFAGCVGAQPLVDFQVAQPPPLPQDAEQCTVQILQRTFGFSFGDPEIVNFTPPTDCGPIGSWAGISLNFTVTSNGTQFDRLGIFTFQNVEIWRTSTPEPTTGDGIIWTYLKDVTRFLPLFSKAGSFILQLDNLIETGLDGEYATTLHATFFASSAAHPPAPHADLIVPVTTLANNTGNDASVPPAFSLNITLPQNTVAVYAELLASGNGNEEFWYFNTANEFLGDLPSGTSFGNGPFREVRLLIDGLVAGTAFPYAVIFTGGIVPTAWRPITSYGALDLPSYFLDVTPFVPLLTDGKPHNFTLDVVSAETDHVINQNWFVSGLLQVVTDPSGKPTTGKINVYNASPFAVTSTTGSVADNGDVVVTVSATRDIHIESTIVSGSGKTTKAVFSQHLTYSNTQSFLNETFIQDIKQTATGAVLSTHNGVTSTLDDYQFPLNINITFQPPSGNSFVALFDHSYNRQILPSPFILGSTIQERQVANGFFEETANGNFGNGTSNNTFSYVDTKGNTFTRKVDSVNTTITFDQQGGSLSLSAKQQPGKGLQSKLTFTKPRLPGGRSALQALVVLAETCSSVKLALEGEHTTAIDSPSLDVLRKDYLSLLTLIYTSTTKASLVLRPSEPAYKASLAPVQDLTKHISALTTCAALFDKHGLILAREVQRHTASIIEHVRALAETLQRQGDASNKDYLVRTGAVHDAVEQIREELPADNNAAVQRKLLGDRDLLTDCLEEIQAMTNEKGDHDQDDESEDWDEDGLEELGFGSNKPLSAVELMRVKKCGELMRWTCALHKKILRDFQSKVFAGLPISSTDLLPEHSHQLLLAAEDLVASLYAPQDPAAVRHAVDTVNDKFQVFRVTLFGRTSQTVVAASQSIEERMGQVSISNFDVLPKTKLPHGYETSFQVLAKCISEASEETPPE